jgi:hypothetical protein
VVLCVVSDLCRLCYPFASPENGTHVTDPPNATRHRIRGRLFLLSGLALGVLGVVAYAVQMSLQKLMAPWYMPILALLGVIVVAISVVERRTLVRMVALLAVGFLATAELGFLYAVRLPAYSGPLAVGRPFPAFEATRADGRPFTQRDLLGDQNSAIVFFRGRW